MSEAFKSITPRGDIVVDTMRAIACIALVSFHTAGSGPDAGMELDYDHWLSIFNRVFVDMRMPLFSFISGLVFVNLSSSKKEPHALVASKARRLLIPMVTVGLLFWTSRELYGQVQPPAYNLFFFPYVHFWFLQATFLIMTTFVTLTAFSGFRDVLVAGLLLGSGAVAWVTGFLPAQSVFSVNGAVFLLPFFMAGYLCQRLGRPRFGAKVSALVLVILIVVGAALALKSVDTSSVLRRSLSIICGLTFCVALLSLRLKNLSLARLGAMSYAVFLFHVFFIAGAKEIMTSIWSDAPDVALWFGGIAAGLLGPIALYIIILRSTIASFVFLGLTGR